MILAPRAAVTTTERIRVEIPMAVDVLSAACPSYTRICRFDARKRHYFWRTLSPIRLEGRHQILSVWSSCIDLQECLCKNTSSKLQSAWNFLSSSWSKTSPTWHSTLSDMSLANVSTYYTENLTLKKDSWCWSSFRRNARSTYDRSQESDKLFHKFWHQHYEVFIVFDKWRPGVRKRVLNKKLSPPSILHSFYSSLRCKFLSDLK